MSNEHCSQYRLNISRYHFHSNLKALNAKKTYTF